MSYKYQRYENESPEELIFRICSHKNEIGTWSDVGRVLNELLGENYTESAYRKKYQSFEKMFSGNQNKDVSLKKKRLNSVMKETLGTNRTALRQELSKN